MTDYGQYSDEFVRTFIIAAHRDLEAVKATLAEHPDLLNVVYRWDTDNEETPLGAAAHVGNATIAEFLLDQGAPMTICAAASLGRADAVAEILADDPEQAGARGAHNIPLMTHVALGGSVSVAEAVAEAGGASPKNLTTLLHMAVSRADQTLVTWALRRRAILTQEQGDPTIMDIIGNVIIFVEDMDAQLAWYQDNLGLTLKERHGDWAVFDTQPVPLAMHGGAEFGAAQATQRTLVTLTVGDYAAAKADLESKGIEFIFENESPSAIFGTFRDPEGTQIQILQRL